MKTKGIFLPQETMETCGISCILMALTAFGVIRKPKAPQSDRESAEQIFYRMYGCRATKGTLGSAIAYALAVRRLNVVLAHAHEEMLLNRDGYFPPELHAAILAEHRKNIEKAEGRFEVKTGVRIDADMLRGELARERLVIVQCLIPGDADGMHESVLHWILLFDFADGVFKAYDPLYERPSQNAPNYITIMPQELMLLMDTPLGATYISVGEKKKA